MNARSSSLVVGSVANFCSPRTGISIQGELSLDEAPANGRSAGRFCPHYAFDTAVFRRSALAAVQVIAYSARAKIASGLHSWGGFEPDKGSRIVTMAHDQQRRARILRGLLAACALALVCTT